MAKNFKPAPKAIPTPPTPPVPQFSGTEVQSASVTAVPKLTAQQAKLRMPDGSVPITAQDFERARGTFK